MRKRAGVKQVCGSSNQLGELWDGTYPAVVYTLANLQKEGIDYIVWLEAPNTYALWNGNQEITRLRTKKGTSEICKRIYKIAKEDAS